MLYKNFLISTGDDPERDNEAGDGGRRDEGGRGSSRQSERSGGSSAAPQRHKFDPKVPGSWKLVVVCIAKSAANGKKLGELSPKDLEKWILEWKPKPNAAAEVVELRAALDQAQAEKLAAPTS